MCTGNCSGCSDCSGQCVPVGPRGLTGATGATGATGPAGESGNTYITFIDEQPNYSLTTSDSTVTNSSYTIVAAGNYQIHISLQVDLDLGTAATSAISWYLDSTKKQQKILCDGSTAPASLVTNNCINFVWRGAVTANQVFSIHGQIGVGVNAATVKEMSILINKEL